MLKSGRNHTNQNRWSRNSWQRLLAFVCAFVLAVSGTPLGTAAAEGETAAEETASNGTTTVSPANMAKKASAVNKLNTANYGDAIAIYLNGQSGDDGKDGTTPDKAFKSFEKAKEVAETYPSIQTIYVTGTVGVSGDIFLDRTKTNAVVKRDRSFHGYLMEVRGSVSSNNITIDGNGENVRATEALIHVTEKRSLTIGAGTNLQNNVTSTSDAPARTFGGALYIEGGTVEMTGGTIANNTAMWGGGVYATEGAIFTLAGGTIEKNIVYTGDEYAAGGGIAT